MPLIQSQPETSGSPKTYLYCDDYIICSPPENVNHHVILHRFYNFLILDLTLAWYDEIIPNAK